VQLNLNKVLQDIGVITRVEGVAVAEHKDSNLVDAVPAERSLMRANRHYPSDTSRAQKPKFGVRAHFWKNSGSEHFSAQFLAVGFYRDGSTLQGQSAYHDAGMAHLLAPSDIDRKCALTPTLARKGV
jgi:hypothetical protein